MEVPQVVTHEQWLRARIELLAAEKELTRQRDALVRRRRALPCVRIETNYVFDTSRGPRTLVELFEGRRQLILQHFMFGPGWEQGCPSRSFMADHSDGMNVHLKHRDVTLLAVSRAPLADIERFRRRMGWQFGWVSSHGTDFNYDFHISFTPEDEHSGQLVYNLARSLIKVRKRRASACSIRTMRMLSFTPTRPTAAASR